MSQRIVIECDGEHFDDAVEAQTISIRTLGLDFEVDLCDVHQKELREVVVALAEVGRTAREAGRKAPTRASDQGERPRVPCPRCGKTYQNRGSLRSHTEREHGERLVEIEAAGATPPPVPVDDEAVACDVCGKTFRGSRKTQARGSHMSRSHGIAGTSTSAATRRQGPDGSHEGE